MFTEREASALEDRVGGRLAWIEVSTFGRPEREFLLNSPECAYCGTPVHGARCNLCGANVLPDGAV